MVLSGFSGGAYNGPLAAPDDPVVAAEWAAAGLLGTTAHEAVRHVLYGGKTSEQFLQDVIDADRMRYVPSVDGPPRRWRKPRELSPETVEAIRTRYQRGHCSQRWLARAYGVGRTTIWNAIHGAGAYADDEVPS